MTEEGLGHYLTLGAIIFSIGINDAYEEDFSKEFELEVKSPYMLLVAPLKNENCIAMNDSQEKLFGIEKLNIPRSTLPAITHVDKSARVQTVNIKTNPRYYGLIKAYKKNPKINN